MQRSNKRVLLVIGALGALILVAVWFLGIPLNSEKSVFERSESSVTDTPTDSQPLSEMIVVSAERTISLYPNGGPPVGSWREYDEMIIDVAGIDEYILEHLRLAEAGNVNSAHYVSDAMHRCATEMAAFEISFDNYGTDPGATFITNEAKMIEIMDGLVGHHEYYLEQVRQSLRRAVECQKLGWETQYIYEESVRWRVEAAHRGQATALARTAFMDPSSRPHDPRQMAVSKEIIRNALIVSHDLEVLLNASSVVAASTGKDYKSEVLSWALLACEYEPCDTLNNLYMGQCENMSLGGSSMCTDDMTDLDYLFRKYPAEFDTASARAKEIRQAIEREDWESLGLR